MASSYFSTLRQNKSPTRKRNENTGKPAPLTRKSRVGKTQVRDSMEGPWYETDEDVTKTFRVGENLKLLPHMRTAENRSCWTDDMSFVIKMTEVTPEIEIGTRRRTQEDTRDLPFDIVRT